MKITKEHEELYQAYRRVFQDEITRIEIAIMHEKVIKIRWTDWVNGFREIRRLERRDEQELKEIKERGRRR